MAAGAAALLLVGGVVALGAVPASAAPTFPPPTMPTYASVSHYDLPTKATTLIASADGAEIYVATSGPQILVFATATKTVTRTVTLPDAVTDLTLTTSGDLEAVSLDDQPSTTQRAVYDIDPASGAVVTTLLPPQFMPIAFTATPDGTSAVVSENLFVAATRSYSGETVVVHPHEGTLGPVTVLDDMNHPDFVAMTPDGANYFALAESDGPPSVRSGGLAAVDAASGDVEANIHLPSSYYPAGLVMAPDGKHVFAANEVDGLNPPPIYVVDTSTDTLVDTVQTPGISVSGLALSGDGSLVVAPTGSGLVTIDSSTLAANTLSHVTTSRMPEMVPGSKEAYIYTSEVDLGTGTVRAAYSPGSTWQISGGEVVLPGDRDLYAVALSNDGAPGALAHLDLVVGDAQVSFDRLWGTDRYSTAEQVAEQTLVDRSPTGVHGETVFLTSGEEYPDGLGAGPAASKRGGVVLLTQKGALPNADRSFLNDHPIREVIVVGSTASVSNQVVSQVNSLLHGRTPIRRLAGVDRFATSRALVASSFGSKLGHVWIATGQDFPDALATVSAASHQGEPLVLVNGSASTPDSATASWLRGSGVTSMTVVGSTASVGDAVFQGLNAIAPTTRIDGSDLYATSKLVNDTVFGAGAVARGPLGAAEVIASGTDWPDALAGDQLASALKAPMGLTSAACIPDDLAEQIAARPKPFVEVLGGQTSLSADVAAFGTC